MPQLVPTGDSHVFSAEALAILLSVTSTLENERERARLIATGLSSVIACPFSGVGVRLAEGGWAGYFDPPRSNQTMNEAELEQIHSWLTGRRSRRLDASFAPAAGLLKRHGLESLIGYPLATRRDSYGLLLLGLDDAQPLSPEQGHASHLLASTLALGIENLRLRANLEGQVAERTRDLRAAESRQRALLQLTNKLVQNLGRESLLHAISSSLSEMLPFDRASLALLDRDRSDLELQAVVGSLTHPLILPTGYRVPLEDSLFREVVSLNQPRLRNDLDPEQLVAEEQQLYELGVRSYLLYPLYVRGEVIGSLNLSSTRCNAYREADVDLAGEVAAQVALAVANMLSYEEVELLRSRAEQENVYLKQELESEQGFSEIAGRSDPLMSVLKQVEQVAPTATTVLICGETGTGKELIARAIHQASDRKDRPLIKINCAAISAGLVESELFGHEKGSFTGAATTRVGRFEFADGGTLFLDEVGELALETQAKLLRVLQEGEFERVGSNRPIKVDVRLIAATNRNLRQAVSAGEFRSDLYYRLSVFPVELPPLRARREDIPHICDHLLARLSHRLGRRFSGVDPEALRQLMDYAWPGNIRELQNVLERAAILSSGPMVELDDALGDQIEARKAPEEPASLATLEEAERAHVVAALQRTNWVISGQSGAAELLDINPNTLRSRIKKMGISKIVRPAPVNADRTRNPKE